MAAAPTQQQLDQEIAPEEQTVVSDLNSGNYAGAWSTALSTSPLFGTNYGSATKDPLLEAMESGQGLQAIDPSKKWDATSIAQFDTALGQNAVYNGQTVKGVNGQAESLGKNPYGDWGSGAALTGGKDAAANAAASDDNSAPDVGRFAGAKPSSSFLSKYGADIALLVAAVAAPYAAPALAAAVGAGTGAAALAAAGAVYGAGSTAAIDAAFNKPITAKGELIGAAGGAIGSGALKGLSGTIGAATGTGNVGGAAILKGATGAALGGLAGGKTGALIGGVGGAVSGGLQAGVGGATGSTALGSLAGTAGKMAISPLLSSGTNGSAPATYAAPQTVPAMSNVNGPSAAAPYDFSSIGSTVGSLLGPTLQAGASSAGALAASNQEQKADQNAITTQQGTLGNITSLMGAQVGAGNNAFGDLQALQGGTGSTGTAADYSNFTNSPGYQFAVNQGTQAIQRQAAATGQGYTPNTMDAVGQYVTGTASQNYNNYVSQLLSTAQMGASGNSTLANAQTNAGNNISQLQQNIGVAQASGTANAANGMSGVLGGIGNGISSLLGLGGGNSSMGGGSIAGPAAGAISQLPAGFGTSNGGFSTNGDVSGGVNSSGVPNDLATPDYGSVMNNTTPDVDTGDWLNLGGDGG